MDYNQYLAEDFAADESFIAYHHNTDNEAVAFWQQWMKDHPEKRSVLEDARQMIDTLSIRLSTDEFDQEKDRMLRYLETSRPVLPLAPQRSYHFARAAAIALLLGAGAMFFLYKKEQQQTIVHTESMERYVTPEGKRARLTLSDGSIVTLNGGSTLHFPKKFNGKTRDIKLEGEGYFQVAHDSAKPFIVEAGAIHTKVLGTEFNINAYKSSPDITVSLVKGKVSVSDASHSEILVQTQKMSYEASTKKLIRGAFSVDTETAWKDGKLVFTNADFQTVAMHILHTYGYELILADNAASWKYTGTFERSDVLTVVENICFSKHLKFRKEGQKIYLTAEK